MSGAARGRRWAILVGAPLALSISLAWGAPVHGQQLVPWDFAVGFSGFGGEMRFADELFLGTQNLFGGVLGLEAGRGVQVRGFYWQGANQDLDRTEPIFGYGGEVQFDLNLFSLVKPFFVGGYGVVDFDDDFLDLNGDPRKSLDAWILGGGIVLDLARWLRMDFGVRNYLMEAGPVPTQLDVSEESDSRLSNVMVSAGVTITLGRRHGTPSAAEVLRGEAPVPDTRSTQADPTQAQVVAVPMMVTAAGETVPVPPGSEAISVEEDPRYGLAADATLRSILTTEIGYLDALFPEDAPLGEERTEISGARADTLAMRMEYRIHEAFQFLASHEAEAILASLNVQLDQYNVSADAKNRILTEAREILHARTRMVEEDGRIAMAILDTVQARERDARARRRRVSGNVGGSFGNGTQALLGGQLGFTTPWSPNVAVTVDANLGVFGGATSASLQGGLRYFYSREGAQPYAGLSAGALVLSDLLGDREGSSFVFTPVLGVEVPMPEWGGSLGDSFQGYYVEYQGIGFFDMSRILIGLNWGY